MKKALLIFSLLIFSIPVFFTQEKQPVVTEIKGVYKGENLLIENPFASSGVGFCIVMVQVNGFVTTDNIAASTFELSLDNLGLHIGDSVHLKITHKDQCYPIIYNKEVISNDSLTGPLEIRPCMIQGHLYKYSKDTTKQVIGNLNSGATIYVQNVTDSIPHFEGQSLSDRHDGSYILSLWFDNVYEVYYEAHGYQPKKVIIDLRHIPKEDKIGWKLEANIWLDTLTNILNDTTLYNLPVDKMSFNPTTNIMEWDLDYRIAMEKAFSYIFESKSKSDHVSQLEVEKQAEIDRAKTQRIITYSVVGVLLLIGVLLIWIVKTSKQRKKDNELILLQKEKVEKQKAIIEESHKEITDSINYAKRIQSAILPPSKLVKEYLQQSFILYKPKDVVAGDFYWMEHKEGKVLFAAADCTGHGVPGAMVSVICNNGLNRSLREHGLNDPGKILDKTREIVIQEFAKSDEDVKDGMDIALCALKGNKLEYAGAHNPLWIIRNGEILETKANKQPIGKFDNQLPYTTHTFELQKEDTIYIFSDGYPDQFGGEKGKKYKSGKFKKFLLSIQKHSMEEQRELLDTEFENWRGSIEQIDDVCVIGVRI